MKKDTIFECCKIVLMAALCYVLYLIALGNRYDKIVNNGQLVLVDKWNKTLFTPKKWNIELVYDE